MWTFPSGARIRFGHMEHENDRFKYKSSEFQFIGFDELTSFTEVQYRYLISRLRSSKGIRPRLRAGSNPGGEGHEWVLKRFGPWLNTDEEYRGPRAQPGEVLWAITDRETGDDIFVPRGTKNARSRTFIGARVEDNPSIGEEYIANLEAMDPLTRQQLREGNWMARAAPGMFFKRGWFRLIPAEPIGGRFVRFWDRAATEENDPASGKPKNDPDWTVGLKLHISDEKLLTICDIVRFRGSPGEVRKTVNQVTRMDGQNVHVWISLDPGQAGKFEFATYVTDLMGFVIQCLPETGDKITRAKPISAQAQAGNVQIVKGTWNSAFFHEGEAFPTKGVHDDQIDALSGAFAAIHGGTAPEIPERIVFPRRSMRGD